MEKTFLEKSIDKRIDKVFEESTFNINWLALEQLLRDILKTSKPTPDLIRIDLAIAGFTGRGRVYPGE